MRSPIRDTSMQAERDFSITTSLGSPKKKLAGPDYFNSAMFFSCNKKHLLPLIKGPISSRSDHFTELLTRARKVGRGSSRIACRSNRKRRRVADDDRAYRPVIDLSDDDEDDSSSRTSGASDGASGSQDGNDSDSNSDDTGSDDDRGSSGSGSDDS